MSRVNLLTTLFLSVVIFFSFMAPCNAEEIDIPLTVHEALRQGITGIDREQEPVTLGIPFPKGALYEKNGMPQVALQGAQEYQFRTLKKWHDGSVQWVLIFLIMYPLMAVKLLQKENPGVVLLLARKERNIWHSMMQRQGLSLRKM